MKRFLGVVLLGLGAGVGIGFGCAAGTNNNSGGSGGTASTATSPSSGTFGTGSSSTVGPDASCAKFTAAAKQDPTAILFVLDKSASMTTNDKWGTAQLAIVNAIDQDGFDNLNLGLVTFPASYENPPPCLCQGLDQATCNALLAPGVSCGVATLPQVAVASTGTDKSNGASGVRKDIYTYLSSNAPLNNNDDGSPIYGAMSKGYAFLKAFPNVKKRVLILVTDGGFSCTSLSNPQRPSYQDLNMCPDWEVPDTVNTLITQQRTDPTTPVNTFVIGLPGSNSHAGEKLNGLYDVPPYSMLLALSTYAVSGSPDTVDPACDTTAMFTQGGGDPVKPCHIDLSTGTFDANALATAIGKIRGQALGCVYTLPDPPPNETIDPGQVNVEVTQMGMASTLPKRSSASDMCTTDGCWDYNAMGQVELIGKACQDVKSSTTTKVDITVGCTTIVK